MLINRIIAVYFSATYTTKKYVETIVSGLTTSADAVFIDVTSGVPDDKISLQEGDLLVAAAPVYGGRIPESLTTFITKNIEGNGFPAVSIVVYGNRDYDDALLELCDTLENRNVKVLASGAFIARHSIFTQIASDRPTKNDLSEATDFAKEIKNLINQNSQLNNLRLNPIKGNRPYKIFNKLPLAPMLGEECTHCGICATQCPVNAISTNDVADVDENVCMACGRCIIECPENARMFRGEFYEQRAAMFAQTFSSPRKNETYIATQV